MKPSLLRLIISIAAIIVGAWLIMFTFRIAVWLINGLVGLAAITIVIAIIYHFAKRRPASSVSSDATKKPPLRIEREPSKEK